MKNGFCNEAFMAYLGYQFPDVFSGAGSSFAREMVENLVDYAHKHERVSKDQFCEFLCELIPEVEMGEIAVFMDDSSLTESFGIAEKRRVMAERNIAVKMVDGVPRLFVDGKELYY